MTPKRTPARFGLQSKPPSLIPIDSFPFWTWTTPAQANHPNFQLPVVPPSMATINCSSCTHHQSENLYKAQDSRTSRVHQHASLHLLSADCCFHDTFKDERTVFFVVFWYIQLFCVVITEAKHFYRRLYYEFTCARNNFLRSVAFSPSGGKLKI